jgi:hypothetical protein
LLTRNNTDDDGQLPASTTFEWKRSIVRTPARATVKEPRRALWRGLVPRNAREPLPVVVKLRGGPEGWVEVRGRGIVYRCPGDRQILDVLLDLNNAR